MYSNEQIVKFNEKKQKTFSYTLLNTLRISEICLIDWCLCDENIDPNPFRCSPFEEGMYEVHSLKCQMANVMKCRRNPCRYPSEISWNNETFMNNHDNPP